MTYVAPADMVALYDEQLLVEITNYSDRSAQQINEAQLQTACETANNLVDGHLLSWGIKSEDFSARFKDILKAHAARLVMDFLAGTDPQIRDQARESLEWLKSLNRLSRDALENLVLEPALPGEKPNLPPDGLILPSVSFSEGTRWRVVL